MRNMVELFNDIYKSGDYKFFLIEDSVYIHQKGSDFYESLSSASSAKYHGGDIILLEDARVMWEDGIILLFGFEIILHYVLQEFETLEKRRLKL